MLHLKQEHNCMGPNHPSPVAPPVSAGGCLTRRPNATAARADGATEIVAPRTELRNKANSEVNDNENNHLRLELASFSPSPMVGSKMASLQNRGGAEIAPSWKEAEGNGFVSSPEPDTSGLELMADA
jgi:hypothetical protein